MGNRELKLFITEDGSHSLQVPSMEETYHSSHGAIQESNHVFIHNGIEYWLIQNQKTSLRLLEVGFGTGLNALLSALKAEELNLNLVYQTIEPFPLPNYISSQLNYPEELDCDRKIFSAIHDCTWETAVPISNQFTLTKNKASIINFTCSHKFDLLFFDAFAPSKQPDMWKYSIIEKCFTMLNSNGIFITYSAKGQLKRDLKRAGFQVTSVPGPPGKFEMVRATKKTQDC